MAASAALKARCRRPSYLKKLAKAEDLIDMFPHNSYIGWSGFTGVGYPKKVPTALADHVERNNLQGKLKYNLFVGASSGAETENRWARVSETTRCSRWKINAGQLNMIERRSPHQVGKEIAKGINNGNIKFFDKHLSMFVGRARCTINVTPLTTKQPVDLMYGYYTKHKENNRVISAFLLRN
jgi:acetyl-CoA hydrolase